MQQNIVNLSGYKFVEIAKATLPTLKKALLSKANEYQLKGTILISTEGINAFLAGDRKAIDDFKTFLQSYSFFTDVWFKESYTDYQPFNRMLVRIKKEIIPMGIEEVHPEKKTASHITPERLQEWFASNKDMVMLDTRNAFEVDMGTFQNAMHLGLEKFRDFPEAVDYLPDSLKEKPIVTFCTGGIRCEKAAEYMLQKGFKEVYQLQGGIIHYFEQCGGEFYDGECFVFDQRVAIDANLNETAARQCFDCRAALQPHHVKEKKCPECGSTALSKEAA